MAEHQTAQTTFYFRVSKLASHLPGSGLALISQPATTVVRNRRARLGALGRAVTAILDAKSELKTPADLVPVQEDLSPDQREEHVQRIRSALPRIGQFKAKQLVDSGARSIGDAARAVKQRVRSASYKLTLSDCPLLPSVGLEEADQELRTFQGHNRDGYKFHLAGRHRRQAKGAREVVLIATHNDKPRQLLMTSGADATRGQITRRSTAADVHGRAIEEDVLGPVRLRGCTGDGAFVRLMRRAAIKPGLALQAWGLYRRCAADEDIDEALLEACISVRPDKRKPPPAPGECVHRRFVPTSTERAVFEELGEAFVAPDHRNFSNVLPGLPSSHSVSVKRKVGGKKGDVD
ncbi:hypothetical protein AURDEDRAFT_124834 [Auricularia subglabra TFB-10046 SS5]|nr:hypothetical protein AURDEDRAFT_124834 [Auricularia subglabra TFB-10046 SS5]